MTIVFNKTNHRKKASVDPRWAMHGSVAVALAIAASSPGCGSAPAVADDAGAGGGCFLAASSDFADFTRWQHYHLSSTFIPNNVHAKGDRDVYINKCPPPGATGFPVGTIVVKKIALAGQAEPAVFAQVKRGCGYNQDGASGWEWFDLLTSINGGAPGSQPQIVWQGLTPPASQSYGGDPTECNTCHSTMGEGNDSIITPALDLKTIQCKEP